MNSKEVFDIVRELETTQKQIDSKAIQAELKAKHLEEEISQLKKAHAAEIERINQEHSAEIANLNNPKTHESDDAVAETRILVAIACEEGISTERIASIITMGEQKTQLHLDDLVEAGYTTCLVNSFAEVCWYLETKGRRRLANQGLLK